MHPIRPLNSRCPPSHPSKIRNWQNCTRRNLNTNATNVSRLVCGGPDRSSAKEVQQYIGNIKLCADQRLLVRGYQPEHPEGGPGCDASPIRTPRKPCLPNANTILEAMVQRHFSTHAVQVPVVSIMFGSFLSSLMSTPTRVMCLPKSFFFSTRHRANSTTCRFDKATCPNWDER